MILVRFSAFLTAMLTLGSQAFAFTQISDNLFRSNGSQADTQAAVVAIAAGGTWKFPTELTTGRAHCRSIKRCTCAAKVRVESKLLPAMHGLM
jgi:hypothetical protein